MRRSSLTQFQTERRTQSHVIKSESKLDLNETRQPNANRVKLEIENGIGDVAQKANWLWLMLIVAHSCSMCALQMAIFSFQFEAHSINKTIVLCDSMILPMKFLSLSISSGKTLENSL